MPSNNNMRSEIQEVHCQWLLSSNSIKAFHFSPLSLMMMDDGGCAVGATELLCQGRLNFWPTGKVESFPRYISASFWKERCDISIKVFLIYLSRGYGTSYYDLISGLQEANFLNLVK